MRFLVGLFCLRLHRSYVCFLNPHASYAITLPNDDYYDLV